MKTFSFKYGILAVLALSGVLLTSCSSDNDDDEESGKTKDEQPISLSVVEGDGTTTLAEGTTIGVFVYDNNAGAFTNSNVLVTAGEDGVSNGAPTLSSSGNYTLYAYSPFQTDWTDITSVQHRFDVRSDQSGDGYAASDLLIASGRYGENMSLTFQHVMARIVVQVTDLTGKHDLRLGSARNSTDSSFIAFRSMLTSVMFGLPGGVASTLPDAVSDIVPNIIQQTVNRVTVAAIVAPQSKSQADDFIHLSIDGVELNYNPLTGTQQLEGGKTYVYRLAMTEDELVPDGSYVTDWVNSGNETILQGE